MSDQDTQGTGTGDQGDTGDVASHQDDTTTGSGDAQDTSGDTADTGDTGSDTADSGADQRFKDQQGRAVKAEKQRDTYRKHLIAAGLDPETGKPKENKRAPNKDADDRYDALQKELQETRERAITADLRAMGFTHADDLKVIKTAAKQLGIDPVEAADRPYVKAEIERMREERTTKDATPPPKGGAKAPKKVKNAWDLSDKEFEEESARIMSGRS